MYCIAYFFIHVVVYIFLFVHIITPSTSFFLRNFNVFSNPIIYLVFFITKNPLLWVIFVKNFQIISVFCYSAIPNSFLSLSISITRSLWICGFLFSVTVRKYFSVSAILRIAFSFVTPDMSLRLCSLSASFTSR